MSANNRYESLGETIKIVEVKKNFNKTYSEEKQNTGKDKDKGNNKNKPVNNAKLRQKYRGR